MTKYDKQGQEVPDQKPVALSIGMSRPETLQEMIARMVRHHSELAQAQGRESFEEADDFDVEEEELVSPHEMTPMQEETPKFSERRERRLMDEAVAAKKSSIMGTDDGYKADKKIRERELARTRAAVKEAPVSENYEGKQ